MLLGELIYMITANKRYWIFQMRFEISKMLIFKNLSIRLWKFNMFLRSYIIICNFYTSQCILVAISLDTEPWWKFVSENLHSFLDNNYWKKKYGEHIYAQTTENAFYTMHFLLLISYNINHAECWNSFLNFNLSYSIHS